MKNFLIKETYVLLDSFYSGEIILRNL